MTPAHNPRPTSAAGPSSGATAIITALLEARTGQCIGDGRVWRIETALKPLQRELGFDSLDALAGQLVHGEDAALSDRVVDALLNRKSSFFRDAGVIETVADAAAALHAAAPSRRLRLWSAGCSHGQEPLSLAMILDERGLAADVEIVATDVSHAAIARAKAARFSQFEIQRGLSVGRMMTWFTGSGTEWACDPALNARILYRRQNLTSDPAPAGGFDIILCRNVLFYLSPALRAQVFDRLAKSLRPGGLLVLGAGETVIGQTEAFAPSADWRGMYGLALPKPSGQARVTG